MPPAIKDAFKDITTLERTIRKLRDRLFWHDIRASADIAQTIYQQSGHLAGKLELLSDMAIENKSCAQDK